MTITRCDVTKRHTNVACEVLRQHKYRTMWSDGVIHVRKTMSFGSCNR